MHQERYRSRRRPLEVQEFLTKTRVKLALYQELKSDLRAAIWYLQVIDISNGLGIKSFYTELSYINNSSNVGLDGDAGEEKVALIVIVA